MKNKCYKPLAELASKSGLGWDDGKQKVRMTEDVWNKIVQVRTYPLNCKIDLTLTEIKGNPRYEHWKDKEWPYFRVMEKLVEGIIATGAGAFRAGSHNAPIDLDAEFNDENGSEEPAANDAPATPSGAPAILASSDSDREESREPAVAAEVPPTPQATQIQVRDLSSLMTIAIVCSYAYAYVQSPSNKRSSSSSNLSTSSSRKRSKTSENNAELVSASINKLAMNLQSNSPERRQRAIKLLQEDGQFSDDSTVDIVMQLSDTSRADSFLALNTQKLRTKFASKLID